MPESREGSRFELATVVQGLRQELAAAVKQGEKEELRFELQEMELELQVQVTKGGTGKLGLKFLVVGEAGLEGALGKSTTQTVRLKLKPEGKGGGSPKLRRSRG